MTLQALVNLRLKSAGSVLEVRAGETVDLPQAKGDTLLRKLPGKVRVIPDPSPEMAFDLNANFLPDGTLSGTKDFIPSGTRITYRSPLFGEVSGEVIEDKGACVWIWHPIRECECCIPRGWITGWGDDR